MSEHGVGVLDGNAGAQSGGRHPLAARLAIVGLVCLASAAGLLLARGPAASPAGLIVPGSHASLETGFALYRNHCASCHGRFLGGAPGWRDNPDAAPALNETGHAFRHGDIDLLRRVAVGARGPNGAVTMPAFQDLLSPDDMVIVLSYIAAWWPREELLRRAGPDWTFPASCGPGVDAAATDRR